MTQAPHLVFSNPRYNHAGYEMPNRSDQTERLVLLVGELKGKIEGLETSSHAAETSRKEIYKGMEFLGAEMIRANNRIVAVLEDVGELKQDMTPLKVLEQKITFGTKIVAGVGAVIFAVFGYFVRDGWAWFVSHQK